VRRPLPAALLVLCVAATGCGSDGNGAQSETAATSPKEPTMRGGCKVVKAPKKKPDGGQPRPAGPLHSGETYSVRFETSCGDFTVRLDQNASPQAAASFVSLTRRGFFDDTVFHRIVPGFVIQGGDPTASGQGGPGYSTRDVPPPGARYTRGVVAMAKTAQEPSGTAGSQFYVVTGADAGLPAEYAMLGKVINGQATVARIGKLGDPNSGDQGTPSQPVVVDHASVIEFVAPSKPKRKKKH
jgi:cyclophilin family peptidyl-prolyl cis-trans isomerase